MLNDVLLRSKWELVS